MDNLISLFTGGLFGIPQWFQQQASNVASAVLSGEAAIGDIPQAVWNQLFTSVTSIPDVFNSVASGVWQGIAFFLPDGGTFPDPVHDAAVYFGDALQQVAFILPVDDLITVIALAFSIKIALTVYFLGVGLAKFIRGTS